MRDKSDHTMTSPMDLNCSPDLGLLQHLTAEELKQLLNDDSRLENMIKDLPQVKYMNSEREMLLASNKSLADFNLLQQPAIQEICHQLVQLYKIAKELKEEVKEKKTKLVSLNYKVSHETILVLMQAAAAESEEDAETFAEKFLDGKNSIESFLDEFLEKRKLANLRRVKSEKMSDILKQKSQLHDMPHSVAVRPARRKPPPPPPPPTNVRNLFPIIGPNQYASPHPSPIMPSRPAPYPPSVPYASPVTPYPVIIPARLPLPKLR